jgi:hypothetical protein
MMDVDQAAKAMREAEIEDFLEGFNQPTYRGMRDQWGPGGDLVEPARLEWDVGTVVADIWLCFGMIRCYR